MTEIEKMFENAGIEAKEYCDRDSDVCMSCCPNWNKRQTCWKYKAIIPTFTAEKQLELIKWLGTTEYYTFGIFCHQGLWHIFTETINKHNEKFDECLAKLINLLWQDLTDQEKEEIKGILNENS